MVKATVPLLLVEDDEADIENIRRSFKKLNIINPLTVAHNGQEALDLLTDEVKKLDPTPKIILLDINMPIMNGIEFLKRIRKIPELHDLIVFILTTSNNEEDIMKAYDLNVAGYIVKPMKAEEFVEKMAALDLYWSLIEYPHGK